MVPRSEQFFFFKVLLFILSIFSGSSDIRFEFQLVFFLLYFCFRWYRRRQQTGIDGNIEDITYKTRWMGSVVCIFFFMSKVDVGVALGVCKMPYDYYDCVRMYFLYLCE